LKQTDDYPPVVAQRLPTIRRAYTDGLAADVP